VTEGSISSVVPVFGRTGAAKLNKSCGDSVQASSPAMPPTQPRSVPALARVAVSPDNQYAAGVSADGKTVDVWASGSAKPSNSITTSGVTAISWDRSGFLWLAQDDTTWAVPQIGNSSSSSSSTQIPNAFNGKIIGLGIAPDGVRVAAIAQTASGRLLELAAIDHGAQAPGQWQNPTTRKSTGPSSIGQPVRLGPNITDPIALTWYDADDLLVLNGTGNGSALWEVPVDGQSATRLPGILPGAISITADGPMNALVVGLSDGGMDVSASLEGPWQRLGSGGRNPAFPVPAHPLPAQP
jgi:Lipoprotein LpqB beta-propeller domain